MQYGDVFVFFMSVCKVVSAEFGIFVCYKGDLDIQEVENLVFFLCCSAFHFTLIELSKEFVENLCERLGFICLYEIIFHAIFLTRFFAFFHSENAGTNLL